MVNVKVGTVLDLTKARTGNGKYGDWMKVEVKAEKGYDRIDVWVTNAEEAKKFKVAGEITEIQSVKLGSRQYQDKWYPEYSINAKLKQAAQGAVNAVEAPMDLFASMDAVDEAELPFN